MANICTIPDCDQEVKYYHLEVCAACYSGLARWRGRSSARKRKHFKRCGKKRTESDDRREFSNCTDTGRPDVMFDFKNV